MGSSDISAADRLLVALPALFWGREPLWHTAFDCEIGPMQGLGNTWSLARLLLAYQCGEMAISRLGLSIRQRKCCSPINRGTKPAPALGGVEVSGRCSFFKIFQLLRALFSFLLSQLKFPPSTAYRISPTASVAFYQPCSSQACLKPPSPPSPSSQP